MLDYFRAKQRLRTSFMPCLEPSGKVNRKKHNATNRKAKICKNTIRRKISREAIAYSLYKNLPRARIFQAYVWQNLYDPTNKCVELIENLALTEKR